jgi:ubiquinone/menaquinone biosynthesis C-methylase UbiE
MSEVCGGNIVQKEIFSTIEGDKYYERNKYEIRGAHNDPVIPAIAQLDLSPKKILEIGCSNGWRLNILKRSYNSNCWGIDPSAEAIERGQKDFKELNLEKGTADELSFEKQMFDMVIFACCLCYCDRSDLFKIVYEADRVLMDLGHIVIHDFHPPFPYKNKYSHYEGLYCFKMNYSTFFLWNPTYTLKYQKLFFHPPLKTGTSDDLVSVIILQKNVEPAFPENPYKIS